LIVRCYPGETNDSLLYEDDGQSKGYLKGRYAWTRLGYSRSVAGICVRIDPSEGRFDGQPKERGYRIELPCTHKARSAMLDGAPVPVDFDAETLTNIIRIPPRGIDKMVEVLVDTSEIDPLIMRKMLSPDSCEFTGDRVGD
jgi:hypothetical protein